VLTLEHIGERSHDFRRSWAEELERSLGKHWGRERVTLEGRKIAVGTFEITKNLALRMEMLEEKQQKMQDRLVQQGERS
jgi:hypothetical protein